MRNSVFAFALVGMLGLSSCSDTFEPNVDFGDKTYINDYTKLVDAINDLSKTLDERLSALNSIVEQGLYSIKVSVDENTGAITTQTTALKDGLGTLNTTLLEGFSALSTTINSNGDKIVTAINANGELIALHLDKNGQLISAQIQASTADIVAALKDLNTGLSGKLDALNNALSTGFANLTVKVGEIGTQLQVTNNKLDALNGKLDNLDSSVKAQTEKIGELSKNVLDGFNNAEAQLKELNKGIGELNVKVDNQTEAIVKLNSDLTASLKNLADSLSAIGGKLVFAVNEQGKVIAAALDAQNNLIETKLVTSIATLSGNISDLKNALQSGNKDIADAISNIQLICNCGDKNNNDDDVAANIITEDDDKLDDGTYKTAYVKESLWEKIKDSDEAKEQLKEIVGEVQKAELGTTQYANKFYGTKDELLTWKDQAVPSGNGHNTQNTPYLTHEHSNWQITEEPADIVVDAGTVIKNGTTYHQVKRVQPYNVLKVSIQSGCGSYWYTGLYVKDAKNGRWAYYYGDNGNVTANGTKNYLTNIKIYLYDEATGVFESEPISYLFTYEGSLTSTTMTDGGADIDCTGK